MQRGMLGSWTLVTPKNASTRRTRADLLTTVICGEWGGGRGPLDGFHVWAILSGATVNLVSFSLLFSLCNH